MKTYQKHLIYALIYVVGIGMAITFLCMMKIGYALGMPVVTAIVFVQTGRYLENKYPDAHTKERK